MKTAVFFLVAMMVFAVAGSAMAEGVWTTYTNSGHIRAIAPEGDYIWCGIKFGGIMRWDKRDGTYVKYTTVDGLVYNNVEAVAIDHDGVKWFGTNYGLSSFDGTNWTTYTTEDGLGGNEVYAIAEDNDNVKWFGTRGGGVSSFDGTTWTTYTTEDGLGGNEVYAIAEDNDNVKWFGTNGGVSSFDGTTWTTYTIEEGLGGVGCPVRPVKAR